jgi:hypothetical protein
MLIREGALVVATEVAARRLEWMPSGQQVQAWRTAKWGKPSRRRVTTAMTFSHRSADPVECRT